MKTMTRIRKTMLILFAALTMMLVTAGTSQAATLTTKQKIYKSYATFLAKKGYLKNFARYDDPSSVEFTVAYINNDNVPDLLVLFTGDIRGRRTGLLYTYQNGKVKLIGKCPYGVNGYYKKKNFMVSVGDEKWGSRVVEYYTPNLDILLGKGDLYKSINSGKANTYKKCTSAYSAQKISAKTFASLLKKRVGSTKYTKFKPVKLTAANRKRVLGF